jgi:hypothetical protein
VSGWLSPFFPEEIRDPAQNNRKENNCSRVRRKSSAPIHARIRDLRIGIRPYRRVAYGLVQIGTIGFRLRPRSMHAQNQKPEDHQTESDIVKAVHGLKYHIRPGHKESLLTQIFEAHPMLVFRGSAKRTLVTCALLSR